MTNVACYDLARNPPTYDAVAFIVQVAERFGFGAPVTINIAPGPADGFRDDKLWPYCPGQRSATLRDIVVPLFKLLPGATVEYGRREGWGAGQYTIPWRNFVRCNAKGIRPLRAGAISGVCGPRLVPKRVTITLREAEHWPERNSDVIGWRIAADEMRRQGYEVIIVRDTHRACEPFYSQDGPFATNPDAATRLGARARLYESAACNMFVSNGPAWLCMALDAPTLVLKPTCEALGRCYDSAWFKRCSIEPGGQFPNTAPYHRLVWQDDTADNIVRAFNTFMEDQTR